MALPIRSLIGLLLLAAMPASGQAPRMHDGGPVMPAAATVLAQWPVGTFLESVAVAADGTVFVANHDDAAIERVRGGRIERVARLPGMIAGILLLPEGAMLATGIAADGTPTIYRIGADGMVAVLAAMPEGGFLNGLALFDPATALVADSAAGVVWRVDIATGAVAVWARHPLLGQADPTLRFPVNTPFPAANGVKRMGDVVVVSNSSRAVLLRIAVTAAGGAGTPTVWAEQLVGDDFALAPDGTAYVPTHPEQSVVRIGPDGARATIATPAQGIAGPTAVTFGPDGALYVVGNAKIPIEGAQRPATLVRIVPGALPAR